MIPLILILFSEPCYEPGPEPPLSPEVRAIEAARQEAFRQEMIVKAARKAYKDLQRAEVEKLIKAREDKIKRNEAKQRHLPLSDEQRKAMRRKKNAENKAATFYKQHIK